MYGDICFLFHIISIICMYILSFQLNRAEFEGLDDETRVQYEGYRPGMYVRMEFDNFPCEFITNFNASYPVIVGGLLENESNMGFIRV